VLRYQLNQKEEKFILNQKNSKKVFKVKVDVDKSKEQIKSAVGDLVNAPSLYLSDRYFLPVLLYSSYYLRSVFNLL
jgi:hypothetical protein